jgi:chaperonin cofactor prefoldin
MSLAREALQDIREEKVKELEKILDTITKQETKRDAVTDHIAELDAALDELGNNSNGETPYLG